VEPVLLTARTLAASLWTGRRVFVEGPRDGASCQPTVMRPSTAANAMSVRQCASASRTPATRS
jgi:hypothetical protein